MAAIPPAAVADEDEEEDFENQDRTDPLDELFAVLAASSAAAGFSTVEVVAAGMGAPIAAAVLGAGVGIGAL